MSKIIKRLLALGLILCMSVLFCSSVLATSYSSCPRCGYSFTATHKTINIGDMVVTNCGHGHAHQKDVIQNTKTSSTYQCNRCAWYEQETTYSSYLVGHLLYTD